MTISKCENIICLNETKHHKRNWGEKMGQVVKPKFEKYSRLQGIMRELGITVEDLAKKIGRAPSTVSKANNGYSRYDSFDMLNIKQYINEVGAKKAVKEGKNYSPYTIEYIFYS